MKMSEDELIEILRRKEDAAAGYVWGQLGGERETAMREFHRQPYGTEQEGWSQIVASDVRDTVEWILPSLLKTFTATDKAVEFEPTEANDVKGAEQATDACNYVFFKQNNGFLVLYNAIKDALIVRNCAVTWFKEQQETVVSVPFKGASAEMLAMLTQEHGEISEATPAPAIDEQGQPVIDMATGQPVMAYSGRIKRTEKRQVIRVEAFSPEDLLVDREWTSPLLADCPYVARHMRVTVSDLRMMGYKVEPEDLRASADRSATTSLRNVGLDASADMLEGNDGDNDDAMAEGWLRIEYVLIDVDGDGIAERRCIHRLYDKVLSNEECADVPFATFSPRMNTHRWDGESMHDAVGDLQRLHSEILNQTLDNLKLANNPRTKLLTDANGSPKANIDDLLDSRIGGIIRVQSLDAVTEQVVPFSAGASFPMLEYVQGMRENRTGVSRTSQGMNPDSLNNTATGRQIDQTASQQPTELIARIIAECLLKPIMQGILKLLTDGGMEKLSFRLRGEFVEMDPSEWRDSYDMSINVGLGSGDTQARAMQLQNVFQLQQAGLQMGMTQPKHLYHTAAKIVENAGFKDVQNFLQDPSTMPPQPPPPDPEQVKAQANMQLEQAKLQSNMTLESAKMQMQERVDINRQQAEAQQLAMKAQQDAQLAQYQAELDAQKENARLQFEQWKTQFEANTRIQIEHIKRGELLEPEVVSTMLDSQGQVNAQLAQAISDMLQQAIQQIRAPRRIVRDASGRAQGIE
jgi:hypothetical protein